MSTYSLTMQDRHLAQLRSQLIRDDGCEWAAYALCSTAEIAHSPQGNMDGYIKLLSSDVIEVNEADVLTSSEHEITWNTQGFVRALKKADDSDTNKVVAVVHIHPNGPAEFSPIDDANEPNLWELAYNRNGEGAMLVSILLTGDGDISGRVWVSPNESVPLQIIRVVGKNKFRLHYANRGQGISSEAFDRQLRAFGPALVDDLSTLRVGVVGLGGTGSPTALMLARLGVGQIVLFDGDHVDITNLNRLHGARMTDAASGLLKVDVIRREIEAIGLGTTVEAYPHWISDERCHDALKSCDIVFGCTDDDDGRFLLNRLAYYYLIPLFDMGLAIEPRDVATDGFHALDARVTLVTPETTCLSCRGIIDPVRASEQALRRSDPEEYARRKEEAYVIGEGNPNPAVVTFTTECASMAVSEFLNMLHPFRNDGSSYTMLQRRFNLSMDLHPGHKPVCGCPYCDSDERWGRGDVEPFLDRVG